MAWVNIQNKVYFGMRKNITDVEIPDSPSPYHEWNGTAWILNSAKEQEEIIKSLTKSLEDYYDLIAQKKRYDNRLTCALRAGYTGPFQSEGQSFATWMDNCNAYAYTVMEDVLLGNRAIPTAAELLAELPVAPW